MSARRKFECTPFEGPNDGGTIISGIPTISYFGEDTKVFKVVFDRVQSAFSETGIYLVGDGDGSNDESRVFVVTAKNVAYPARMVKRYHSTKETGDTTRRLVKSLSKRFEIPSTVCFPAIPLDELREMAEGIRRMRDEVPNIFDLCSSNADEHLRKLDEVHNAYSEIERKISASRGKIDDKHAKFISSFHSVLTAHNDYVQKANKINAEVEANIKEEASWKKLKDEVESGRMECEERRISQGRRYNESKKKIQERQQLCETMMSSQHSGQGAYRTPLPLRRANEGHNDDNMATRALFE